MTQITIDEMLYKKYQITKPIRLIELFAGVGSQAMALRNIGADFEHYKVVEFDKYAVTSYNAIHNTDFRPMDITKVTGKDLNITHTNYYEYIMTYSFPCQDLSIAGNQRGMTKGSNTRSGLLWEVERLLNEVSELPQVLLMENVPQVIADANIEDFKKWQQFLEGKGYKNYVEVLNAKNYGIPQNRERCFMVSILDKDSYCKFPEKMPLQLVVGDLLEEEVDEKYYINGEKADKLTQTLLESGVLNQNQGGFIVYDDYNSKIREEQNTVGTITPNAGNSALRHNYKLIEKQNSVVVDGTINEPKQKDIANCIKARYDCGISNQRSDGTMVVETKPKRLGGLFDKETKHQAGSVWDKNGISPTIDTMQGGYREPCIIVASRGRNPQNPSDRSTGTKLKQRLEPNLDGLSNTLTTVQKDNLVLIKQATEKGYVECELGGVADLSYPTSKTRRGRVQEGGRVSPTITATETGVHVIDYRIRKLTPKECWRLMGFTDEDFRKAERENSNTQLYKQAGNSIVVNVLEGIFKEML